MIELACRDDVESRLVIGARKSWRVEHGPFRRRDFTRLPPRNWTLLVNGLETVVPAARDAAAGVRFHPVRAARRRDGELCRARRQRRAAFRQLRRIPAAGRRQRGAGRSAPSAISSSSTGAPLKILRRFRAAARVDGRRPATCCTCRRDTRTTASRSDECITWSVGFRAPGRQEMIERFLDFLRDQNAGGRNLSRSRGSNPSVIAGAIGKDMLRQNQSDGGIAALDRRRYRALPRRVPDRTAPGCRIRARAPRIGGAVRAACHARGVRLALPTRMLTSGTQVFINSETALAPAASAPRALHRLADTRGLPAGTRIECGDARVALRMVPGGLY